MDGLDESTMGFSASAGHCVAFLLLLLPLLMVLLLSAPLARREVWLATVFREKQVRIDRASLFERV